MENEHQVTGNQLHITLDAQISEIVDRQYGVITTAQLHSVGVSDRAINHRLASGRLRRAHWGVYAAGHASLSADGRWLAAVLAAGDGAALSHLSAACLWKIWRWHDAVIHVVATRQRQGKPSGLVIHHSRRLDRRDMTTRNRIPVTTVARTLVDLADVLEPHQLTNVVHEAAYRGILNVNATRATLRGLRGRHNAWIVREALDAHLDGRAGTRSRLEENFLEIVRDSVPLPKSGAGIVARNKRIEVDFLWPAEKLIVEVDGPGHDRPRIRAEDRERDRLLNATGHEVIRFGTSDIRNYPEYVQAVLGERLRARQAAHGR